MMNRKYKKDKKIYKKERNIKKKENILKENKAKQKIWEGKYEYEEKK